jgi:hypothetical protein
MKNLLALVGLAVVGFGGVGWYMGWYTLKVDRDNGGHVNVSTKVDTKKVLEDSGNWLQQAGKFLETKVQKASDDAKVQPPGAAGTTPGPVSIPNGNNPTPNTNVNQGSWLLPPQTYPIPTPR